MSLACQVLRNSISLRPPIPQTVKAIGNIAVRASDGLLLQQQQYTLNGHKGKTQFGSTLKGRGKKSNKNPYKT